MVVLLLSLLLVLLIVGGGVVVVVVAVVVDCRCGVVGVGGVVIFSLFFHFSFSICFCHGERARDGV